MQVIVPNTHLHMCMCACMYVSVCAGTRLCVIVGKTKQTQTNLH